MSSSSIFNSRFTITQSKIKAWFYSSNIQCSNQIIEKYILSRLDNYLSGITDILDLANVPYTITSITYPELKNTSLPLFYIHPEDGILCFKHKVIHEGLTENKTHPFNSYTQAIVFQQPKMAILDKAERTKEWITRTVLLTILTFIIFIVLLALAVRSFHPIVYFLYFLSVMLFGLSIALDYISKRLYSNDQLDRVCEMFEKKKGSRCSHLLWSNHSNIFNIIKVSELGVIYSSKLLILFCLLIFQPNNHIVILFLFLLLGIGLFSSLFFIFLQIKIGRYCIWCNLFHGINIILFTGINYAYDYPFKMINSDASLTIFLVLSISTLVYTSIYSHQQSLNNRLILNQIKYNPRYFSSLTTSLNKKININRLAGDIILSTGTKGSDILLVVSLKCGECDHIIKDIMNYPNDNNNLTIRIIRKEYVPEIQMVLNLIYSLSHDAKITAQTFFDYFSNKLKFTPEYISNQIRPKDHYRTDIAKIQQNWFERYQISRTPIIYINGYEVPKEYSYMDVLALSKYIS